jgi:uncharacterized membrane protein
MSLESAKKIGFTASIIELVVPIVAIALLVAFYALLFSSIFSSVSGGSTSFYSVWFASAFPYLLIPIAALSLAGLILFLIAMHRLSQYYNEKVIFKNPLNVLIIQIIGSAVLMVVVFIVTITSFGSLTPTTTSTATTFFSYFIWLLIGVVVIAFVISVYCGLLYKRAFDKLAEKSGVDSFRTAGLLYLIGSILGSLITWIAWIFIAQGFKKLTPNQPASQQAPYTTYQPFTGTQTTSIKRCPACGAENSPDSLYCAKCGRQL